MVRNFLNSVIRYIVRFVPLIAATLSIFFSLPSLGAEKLKDEIAEQTRRIAALEQSYSNAEIQPVDQNAFFKGNLSEELAKGIKFNELRYTATHNSYETPNLDEVKQLYANLSELTFGLISAKTGDFSCPTLTDQLSAGIYSLELDIEVSDQNGNITFTCMHAPRIQMNTSCYNLELGMKEIKMWSDNNPGHLPITVIIEPKDFFIPMENLKSLNITYAQQLDSMLRRTLGSTLFTPADMMRDYKSLGAMRRADDWCKVSDMLGKVLILMHECNTTEKYIDLDESLKSQAMFPMLREGDLKRDCASFIILNDPERFLQIFDEAINTQKLIVRTTADSFGSISEKRRELALNSGAQIVSTDYPVKLTTTQGDYTVSFGNNKTITTAE